MFFGKKQQTDRQPTAFARHLLYTTRRESLAGQLASRPKDTGPRGKKDRKQKYSDPAVRLPNTTLSVTFGLVFHLRVIH